jgi:Ca2+-binding RTX toxin-like protein
MGGSDSIRATGSSRSDRPGFPDRTFNGDDVVLSDFGFNGSNFQVLGNDRIELGGGDNVVLDLGGNDVVRTLEGSDTVLTSILAPGNDDISVGGGDDVVNPGGGNDTVRGGAGQDDIILENDGFADRLVYLTGDVSLSPATTDVITGFDYAGGLDKIDVRGLGLTASMRRLFVSPIDAEGDGLRDILIGWDTNPADTAINFYTTIISDAFSPTGALLLTNANFIYADAIV